MTEAEKLAISSIDKRSTDRHGKKRTSGLTAEFRLKKIRGLVRRDGNFCHWCKAPFSDELVPTLDHIVPRRFGGTEALTNLVLACEPCNNGRANPPLGRRRTKEDG